MAAAAVLLVAFVGEGRNNNDEGHTDGAVKCEDSEGAFAPKQQNNEPHRNFVATSASPAQCEHSSMSSFHSGVIPNHDLRLQRAVTSKRMSAEKSRHTFFSSFEVDFDNPLGSGAYGDVYLCRERGTGEACALKKIPKEFTEDDEFQREMNALLHIRSHGGHPNICMLRENFDEEDDYLLVLDLVDGGEIFEHLIEHGAYSEADASRLLRQVASALDFIHGIGVVHADLKPENVMLRKTRGDAVIKLIDFGCSEVLSHPEEEETGVRLPSRTLTHQEGATTAYCPPEAFDGEDIALDPSADMWALGVIVYMMLVGRHPFDLDCDASDEDIAQRIKEQRRPPLKDCPFAGDLSPSAHDLISKLMEPDPSKRLTAHDMLHHPWVTGETASEDVMEDSAKRLKRLHRYKSGIEKTVIERLLSFDDEVNAFDMANDKQSSLLERAFDHIDKDKKGFLSREDLTSLPGTNATKLRRMMTNRNEAEHKMSFNHFSDLIGQNMKSVHFKKGQVVYNEDDDGDFMYFINSGTIEVSTRDGFRAKKGQGDHFGKGGIVGRKRRTTITCTTPVNALRVDKDFFSKYIVKGSPLATKLRETANKEKFDRALSIMERNGNMSETAYKKGDFIFKEGEVPHDAYIVKEGLVDVMADKHNIYSVKTGRIFGIQSQILKRGRKASTICASDACVIKSLPLEKLEKLANDYPVLKSTLHELALRQEFRRAVVLRRMKSFPNKEQLKEAFDEIDVDSSGTLDAEELRILMESLGASFSDDEISTLVKTLDLNESGTIDFNEFEHVFSEN
eukprot:CAMPEP_0172530022 /NCGR_PEP_ID=MMETSP1067-20121228/3905_1 /TAXON_ID=265564 ORGANISM="Thalassiosira punctigera, Strain Tpunct2005C2" /NCGR_SAMPLE_ID=MMETSP1067 /ASSEMBLY_ACC=CAM_ASM_000444 /LENGTH=791 /DNA_ID=CAMNT_0013314165 /DNA_START=226 /DNA_END=2601 /DNA_ORIENTATION=-